jgi:hypothetical protein
MRFAKAHLSGLQRDARTLPAPTQALSTRCWPVTGYVRHQELYVHCLFLARRFYFGKIAGSANSGPSPMSLSYRTRCGKAASADPVSSTIVRRRRQKIHCRRHFTLDSGSRDPPSPDTARNDIGRCDSPGRRDGVCAMRGEEWKGSVKAIEIMSPQIHREDRKKHILLRDRTSRH